MAMMKIVKVEIPKSCFHKKEKGPECKGLIFRGHTNCYISSYHSVEVKKSLRLLKRLSCKGCTKCEWVWDEMAMDILDGEVSDALPDIEDGKLYKLKTVWIPGTYEYPNDGEMEFNFESWEKDKHEK